MSKKEYRPKTINLILAVFLIPYVWLYRLTLRAYIDALIFLEVLSSDSHTGE